MKTDSTKIHKIPANPHKVDLHELTQYLCGIMTICSELRIDLMNIQDLPNPYHVYINEVPLDLKGIPDEFQTVGDGVSAVLENLIRFCLPSDQDEGIQRIEDKYYYEIDKDIDLILAGHTIE